jgi:glycosyltransferase involved in cell wall biosynthesis
MLEEYAIRDDHFQGLKVRRVKVANKFWLDPSDNYLNSRVADIFADYVDEVRPALVHIHHTVGLSSSIVEVAVSKGVPVVLQMRDFYYMCQKVHLFNAALHLCDGPEDGRKCADCIKTDSDRYLRRHETPPPATAFEQAGIYRTEYMRRILLLPDTIICPSPFVKEKYVEFGVPANKMIVSPTGIKLPQTPMRQEGPNEGVVFGFIGQPSYYKGIDTLLDAFGMLDQTRAELRICGGEPEVVERLRKRVNGLSVQFLGNYSHEQLPDILSHVDVVVQPSICHESYSLAIREAFAAGIPVIVSNIRAQMDAVRNEKNGLHFRAGDAVDLSHKMNLFIQNPALLHDYSKHIPHVRSITDQASEFAKIYQKLIQAKRRSRPTMVARLSTAREYRTDALLQRLEQVFRPSIVATRDQLESLRNERESLRNELEAIHGSLGYKWMTFYSSRIDRLMPDGTKRGKLRKKVTSFFKS